MKEFLENLSLESNAQILGKILRIMKQFMNIFIKKFLEDFLHGFLKEISEWYPDVISEKSLVYVVYKSLELLLKKPL